MLKHLTVLLFAFLALAACSTNPAVYDPCADYGFCADQIVDPGTGSWQAVAPSQIEDVCRLDAETLRAVTPPDGASFAVIRYGRLCYVSGENGSDATDVNHVFSVTKTLGAVLTGMVMHETRDLPPSTEPGRGPLREFDRMDKWLDLPSLQSPVTINPDATVKHVLAMVAYNEDLGHGAKRHRYDANGNREINQLISVIDKVVQQDPEQLGADAIAVKDRLFNKLGFEHSSWGVNFFGYSWNTSLLDMGRLGLLILNGGIYNGERILDTEYVYNLTHPAFEDGSTNYGYLTWVNTTTCAPRAIYRHFPHGLSQADSCGLEGGCEQRYDVGAWSANGARGQFIIGHRGLDLVVVGQNWRSTGGDRLWLEVLPAIVKADPLYQGDQEGFCAAYGSNNYAPDLRKWEGNL